MKFSGKIGFWIEDVEMKPGVFKPQIIEKNYTGDVLRNIRRSQSAENQQNENLVVKNKLSIISDLYLQQNWGSIKYVSWNGVNFSGYRIVSKNCFRVGRCIQWKNALFMIYFVKCLAAKIAISSLPMEKI